MPVPSDRTQAPARDQAKRRPAFPPVRKEFYKPESKAEPKQTWLERLIRFKVYAHRLLTGIPQSTPFHPHSAKETEGRSESQYSGNPARPFQVRSAQARALRARSK